MNMNHFKTNFVVLMLLGLIACNCSNKTNKSTSKVSIQNPLDTIKYKYRKLALFKGDTLLYLKTNFINNKQYFIGKNISYLLKNLELPVNKYLYSPTFPPNSVYNHISLQFTNDVTVQNHINKKQSPLILILDFEQPISILRMREIQAITKGKWGSDAIELFGNEKIKDIEMVTKGF